MHLDIDILKQLFSSKKLFKSQNKYSQLLAQMSKSEDNEQKISSLSSLPLRILNIADY